MKYKLILIIFLATIYSAKAQLKVKLGDTISLNLPEGTKHFYDSVTVDNYLQHFNMPRVSAEKLIGENYKKGNLTFNLHLPKFITKEIKAVEDSFIEGTRLNRSDKGKPFESYRLAIGDNSFVVSNYSTGDKAQFAFRGTNTKSGRAFYIIMSGPQTEKAKMKTIVEEIIKSAVIK